MICPQCKYEVTVGYLACAHASYFAKEPRYNFAFGKLTKKDPDEFRLGPFIPIDGCFNIPAYHCPHCKAVVVDTSEYEK